MHHAEHRVTLRLAETADEETLWQRLLSPVFAAGETYCVPRDASRSEALGYWLGAPHEVHVATDPSGAVIGTYFLTPNQPAAGGGGHVANAGFITAPGYQGRGVTRAMLAHALTHALRSGYRAMQFNFVVSTNSRAIATWEHAGFARVGTLPRAFNHPTHGYVDAYVMYRELVELVDGAGADAIEASLEPLAAPLAAPLEASRSLSKPLEASRSLSKCRSNLSPSR